jgi:hypothetical protein
VCIIGRGDISLKWRTEVSGDEGGLGGTESPSAEDFEDVSDELTAGLDDFGVLETFVGDSDSEGEVDESVGVCGIDDATEVASSLVPEDF